MLPGNACYHSGSDEENEETACLESTKLGAAPGVTAEHRNGSSSSVEAE